MHRETFPTLRSCNTFACAAVLFVSAALAGCGQVEDAEDLEGESQQDAIYNGTAESPGMTGVVQVGNGSGVIYSRFWVLAAAHIFAPFDRDGNSEITGPELCDLNGNCGINRVHNVPNESGVLRQVPIVAIYRHPGSTNWAGDGVDIAMVLMDSASGGAAMNHLSFLKYTNGRLNIFEGQTSALDGKEVRSYGYGTNGNSTSGTLTSGRKKVTFTFPVGYEATHINGAGTSCEGDSGGPDYLRTGTLPFIRDKVVGIHHRGDFCMGVKDLNYAAPAWRDWVIRTELCGVHTGSGICHF